MIATSLLLGVAWGLMLASGYFLMVPVVVETIKKHHKLRGYNTMAEMTISAIDNVTGGEIGVDEILMNKLATALSMQYPEVRVNPIKRDGKVFEYKINIYGFAPDQQEEIPRFVAACMEKYTKE